MSIPGSGLQLKLVGGRHGEKMCVTFEGPGLFGVCDRAVDPMHPHVRHVNGTKFVMQAGADAEIVAVGIGQFRTECGVGNGAVVVGIAGPQIKFLSIHKL